MIQLVTDSTANLPSALVQQYKIIVVPLKVHMGNETYYEGVTLTQEEFLRQLPNANPHPTTSQPSPADFQKIYSEMLLVSEDTEIISLHISDKLSGTYNSAFNGAKNLDESRISVVDSRTVSAGLALLVFAAAKMAEAGKSRKEIVAAIESLSKQSELLFTLDTLEYLRRGGRIGTASALIGALLGIKPILKLEDGRLGAGKRARSRRKALQQIIKQIREAFGQKPVWVALGEAQAKDLDEFEQMVRNNLNAQEVIQCQIGPVVATHTGPNTLGVAVMPAPKI